MLTREDIYLFSHSTDSFLFNQAVTFKTVIQNEIADLVTPEEALYIVLPNFKINYNIIDKLINVAAKYWKRTLDKRTLYCLGMAVATIIKEYGWGTYYLGNEGFISLTNKIASVQ